MRLLARYRLSRVTDASTSLERQKEGCEAYAKIHGHEIVAEASDPDVSGGLSPFEAPQFGEALRHPEGYDGIIAWKLDRLGRTLFGLNDLFKWVRENDKILISVEDNLDLSTWVGRLVASVIAGVAEGELEAIKLRTRDSQKHLRAVGRWHGGHPPYGYRSAKKEVGYVLEPHPDQAPVVRDIFDRAVAGESLRYIADALTAEPPQGEAWARSTVAKILRSRAPLGQSTHYGRLVLDDEGLPLQRAEAIVPPDVWMAAQYQLAKTSRVKTRKHETGLLLDIAFCVECGSKLYHLAQPGRGGKKVYHYWKCARSYRAGGCPVPVIPADQIEPLVIEEFMSRRGDAEIVERVYVGGTDSAAQRQRLDDALASARKEKDLGLYEGDEQAYLERVSALVAQRKALPDADTPQWVTRGTGETYREQWAWAETTTARRSVLLRSGITVRMRVKPSIFSVDVRTDVLDKNLPVLDDRPSAAE